MDPRPTSRTSQVTSVPWPPEAPLQWKVHSNQRICPSSLESHQSLDHDPWDLTNQRPSRGSAPKINKSQKAKEKHPQSWNSLHTTSCRYTNTCTDFIIYIFFMLSSSKAHRICSVKGGLSWNFWEEDLIYIYLIMFMCVALFGNELVSSGGWNQAYCGVENARIGVSLFTLG